jgi:hypothetical protein
MAHATCLVWFISTDNGHSNKKKRKKERKKEKKKLTLGRPVLVKGT